MKPLSTCVLVLLCSFAVLGAAQDTCTSLYDFFGTNGEQFWWLAAALSDSLGDDPAVTVLLPVSTGGSPADALNYVLPDVYATASSLVAASEVETIGNTTANIYSLGGNIAVDIGGEEYTLTPVGIPYGQSIVYLISQPQAAPGVELGEGTPGPGTAGPCSPYYQATQNPGSAKYVQVIDALQPIQGDLWPPLYDANSKYTVFIPNNEAWNELAGSLGYTFNELLVQIRGNPPPNTGLKNRIQNILRFNIAGPILIDNQPFERTDFDRFGAPICLNSLIKGFHIEAFRNNQAGAGIALTNPRTDKSTGQPTFVNRQVQACNSIAMFTDRVLLPGDGTPVYPPNLPPYPALCGQFAN